jgi:hypothetical protein
MADPYQVFRASPGKHRTLLALWPDLHAALMGVTEPEAERVFPCVIGECAGRKPPTRAAARLTRWGNPACAGHVIKHADRPGGWPLQSERGSK